MFLSVPPANWPTGNPADPYVNYLLDVQTSYFPGGQIGYPAGSGFERYPAFCELRVLDGHANFDECRVPNATPPPINLGAPGFIYEQYIDGLTLTEGCRLLRPIKCPNGLQLATSKTCRGIQRRTWTCDHALNEVHHNLFNKCIRPTASSGTNLACNPRPSSMTQAFCEDYVGSDYVSNPAATGCDTAYATGTPVKRDPRSLSTSNAISTAPTVQLSSHPNPMVEGYWCSYDAQMLRKECHYAVSTAVTPSVERPSDCSNAIPSICIKRASGVGGCAAIADAVKCRAYEAAYETMRVWDEYFDRIGSPSNLKELVPLDYVRSNDCTPCLVLPFRPAPSYCPSDIADPGLVGRQNRHNSNVFEEPAELKNQHDAPTNDDCGAPPAGSLSYKSTHVSQLALVNSAVLVMIEGLELGHVALNNHYTYTTLVDPPILLEPSDWRIRFRTDPGADTRIKTWLDPDAATSYAHPEGISENHECVVEDFPTFRLVVRELWPDYGADDVTCANPASAPAMSDAELIWSLFGEQSLSWWCTLSVIERQERTEARGLAWGVNYTIQANLDARINALTYKVPCASGVPPENHASSHEIVIWCRWVPARSGFHQIHAGGAWPLLKVTAIHTDLPNSGWLANRLNNLGTSGANAIEAQLTALESYVE